MITTLNFGVAPLGLHHGDHVITGRAARAAVMGHGTCRLISYADLPYAITTPQLVNDKIAEIQDTGAPAYQVFGLLMGRDRASMTRCSLLRRVPGRTASGAAPLLA